jgi:hypothetical protein
VSGYPGAIGARWGERSAVVGPGPSFVKGDGPRPRGRSRTIAKSYRLHDLWIFPAPHPSCFHRSCCQAAKSAADDFEEDDEVSFGKILCASVVAAVFATPALAQESVWGWRPGLAYVVGMDGTMKVMQPRDPSMAAFRKHARPVPRGMMFFVDNGQVYMMRGSRSVFESNF